MKLQVSCLYSSQLSFPCRKNCLNVYLSEKSLMAFQDGAYYRMEFCVSRMFGLTFRQELEKIKVHARLPHVKTVQA